MADILTRSMEANILSKMKEIYILSRSMEADILSQMKEIYILSRSMEADILKKYGGRYFEKVLFINLFYSVHRHSYSVHYHGCSVCHRNS